MGSGLRLGGGGSAGGGGLPALPSADGDYALHVKSGVKSWKQIVTTMVLPGFAPTLSMSSGGNGPLEVGDVWTPRLLGSPMPNAAGVTAYVVSDNVGGTPVSRLGASVAFQGPASTYTRSAPSTVSLSASVTQNGDTATTNAQSCAFQQRFFAGIDTASGATGASVSTNNAVLSGGGASATLTGAIAAAMIGTILSYTISSGSYWVYALYPHTASAGTFVDNATNFGFAMSVVATFSFTNQFGIATSYDLYRSDFIQTLSRTVRRTG